MREKLKIYYRLVVSMFYVELKYERKTKREKGHRFFKFKKIFVQNELRNRCTVNYKTNWRPIIQSSDTLIRKNN